MLSSHVILNIYREKYFFFCFYILLMLHYSCPIILLLLLPPSGNRLRQPSSLTSLTVLAIWKRKMENALYVVCTNKCCNNTNKMFLVFIIKYIIIKKLFKIRVGHQPHILGSPLPHRRRTHSTPCSYG